MNSTAINRSGSEFTRDLGELGSIAPSEFVPIMRAQLLPGEEAASLPPPPNETPGPLSPLTEFLGPLLTVANPAWSGDPIPRMRALQKSLVAHSLTLEEKDRSELMGALMVVENAVQLRLRWQQMRMTDSDMQTDPGEGRNR